MDELVLGTRYYGTDRFSNITPRMVMELPFILPQHAYLKAEDALREAMRYAPTVLQKTDSISVRDHITEMQEKFQSDFPGLVARIENEPAKTFNGSLIALVNSTREQIIDNTCKIPAVGSYLLPGTEVWIPVTPYTHRLYGTVREHPYFVLHAVIKEVHWEPRSGVRYTIKGSNFYAPPWQIFTSPEDATKELCVLLEAQVPAKALPEKVVIREEGEEKMNVKSHDERV